MRSEKILKKEESDSKKHGKVKLPKRLTNKDRDDLLIKLAKIHGLIEEV